MTVRHDRGKWLLRITLGLASAATSALADPSYPRQCIQGRVNCSLECYSAPADLLCPPGGNICQSTCGGGTANLRVQNADLPPAVVLVASRLIQQAIGDLTTEGFMDEESARALAEGEIVPGAAEGLRFAVADWLLAVDQTWTEPGWYLSRFDMSDGGITLAQLVPPSESTGPVEIGRDLVLQTLVGQEDHGMIAGIGRDEAQVRAMQALAAAGRSYLSNRDLFLSVTPRQ